MANIPVNGVPHSSTSSGEIEPVAEEVSVQRTSVVSPVTEPIPSALLLSARRRPDRRTISLILLAIILLGIVVPLIVTVSYGLRGYTTYTILRAKANSGVQHLLNVKTLFSSNKTSAANTVTDLNTSNLFDTNKLILAGKELTASRNDFSQVRSIIDHTGLIQTIVQYAPQYRQQVTSARAASQVGMDVANVGLQVVNAAMVLAPKFRKPLLDNSSTPLVTSADLNVVRTTIDRITPSINDIQQQMHNVSLQALPISQHQREQVQQVFQLLPQITSFLAQSHTYLDAAAWVLGVNEPRTLLVQTMDRSELRATGGFTGQYGELHINGGRLNPFSLRDISLIEYADNSPTLDKRAPAQYRSWWPFDNWGLRDSNLSADFPTSAQIAINQYNLEVKHKVDGVVLFTPFLIEDILKITGPINIPGYNEIITSQNLEERLHYYQLDNNGIARQSQIQGNDNSTSDRKRFTSLVARTLLDTVRHASPQTLLSIGEQMLYDLRSKDLQIYVSNPTVENLLVQYGYAAQIDRSLTHDGVYIVQSNVSASKASQYVHTSINDTVTLGANGGATHVLQLHLDYNQIGPVYGLDTYRDYIRIYVPPSAVFRWGDGFDNGKPLCGGTLDPCPQNGIYPHDELVCPTGLYDGGYAAPMLNDEYAQQDHPLDEVGAPTNFNSDELGRAMFGGYVIIPKNCTMTVTLSWYVPPLGHEAYDLLVQRQAGTFPDLNLTILPTSSACSTLSTHGLHFDGIMTQDASFSLKNGQSNQNGSSGCYPYPGL